MADWNSLRDNPVSNFLLGPTPQMQPGAGGKLGMDRLQEDPAHPGQFFAPGLQQDPVTGMYFDPQTGTTYQDPAGQNVVTDPNVAQQVAANFQRAQQFTQGLSQTQGRQQGLEGQLRDVIAGRGPSLVSQQASANLDQAAAEQRSQAAGISGAAGPLAQLLAMRNTGLAQIGAGNAATMGRAAEASHARDALASLLAQESQTQLGAGLGFGQMAASGQAAQQGLDAQTAQQNQDFMTKITGATAKGIGGAGAAGA